MKLVHYPRTAFVIERPTVVPLKECPLLPLQLSAVYLLLLLPTLASRPFDAHAHLLLDLILADYVPLMNDLLPVYLLVVIRIIL